MSLNNTGLVYDTLGEGQKALGYYGKRSPSYGRSVNRFGEAATLTNIGSVYDRLDEKQKALDYYEQASPSSGP